MRRVIVTPTHFLNLNFPRFSSLPVSLPPCENFVTLLKSSYKTTPSNLQVENLHSKAIKSSFIHNGQVGNWLLNLYLKCSSIDIAHKLFDEMTQRDTYSWSLLISSFSRAAKHEVGLSLFAQMLTEGVLPNCFTLTSVFKCCINSGDLRRGKGIHGWMLRNGVEMDRVLENTMVDFCAKCGAFGYAKRVFGMMRERDAISWNIMIAAYLESGDVSGAIELFRVSPLREISSWNTIVNGQMQNGFYSVALHFMYEIVDTGLQFSPFTFSMALTLAGTLGLLELGREIHCQILRIGYENDEFVRNSLIDMYCKCGRMEASMAIFCNAVEKTIEWSSIIAGFVQNGRGEEALMLFSTMLQEGISVDQFTLTSVSSACSDAGILEQGMQVHACVEKLGHGYDAYLASAVTDMYAKCGSIEYARKAFNTAYNSRNVVLWTSMIRSYASHGHGEEAIDLFEKMLEAKIIPNEISFVSVLSACSHSGLVKEGYKYFRSMQNDYGIVPSTEHFTCMVDLLGRGGLLNKAKEFIDENRIGNQSLVWKALLSACRVHNNTELAMLASEQLLRLNQHDVGSYVLLSNIYANNRKFAEVNKLRNSMRDRGMSKEPGQSWIQLKNKIHVFVVGDRSHPEAQEIYSYWELLMVRLKELGYRSRTDLVLHDLEEEEQIDSVISFHSEKLAIAYGIISTPNETPLRVMKNLRVCVDCHEAIKYISRATSREIVLRDAHRFHHFKDGECSCGDYW